MGLYINEASRRSQIQKAEQKMKFYSTKIAHCFGKLLSTTSKKKDEVELTRLFLEGVIGYTLYSSIKRELISESAKYNLADFIEKEFQKQTNKNKH